MKHSLNFKQKTISKSASISGVGLHSGINVNLKILPAPSDHGIQFQRVDNGYASVKAIPDNIFNTELNTTIGTSKNSVATIEHLMAAFAALDIDNALIQLDGPEVPILDGSALPFLELLKSSGIHYLEKPKSIYVLKDEISIEKDGKYIKAKPFFGQKFLCTIDFDFNSIGYQKVVYNHSQEAFEKIANARTFCHLNDVEKLRSNGLALGGSLDNALVVSNDSILNHTGLRCPNEFVKHKLLDLIGDLWLLNKPLYCEVDTSKSGHSLHCDFVKALLANPSRYLNEVVLNSNEVSPLYQRKRATQPSSLEDFPMQIGQA